MKGIHSIRTKLIAIMALLVLVPVIALTVTSMIESLNQGKSAADEINGVQAAYVAEQMEKIYTANIEALRSFALSPAVISYLENGEPDEAVEAQLLAQLLKIDQNMGDGNSTAFSDSQGEQRVRTIGKCVNVAEREYFKMPMSGAPYYVSDMIISKSTGTAIATISVPIIGSDGKTPIGVVQRNYDTNVLHDLLASDVIQDRQEIVMVDRTGTVVAHSLREVNVEDPEKQDQNPFYTDSRGGQTSGDYIAPFARDTWIISWEKLPTSEWIVASCRVQEVALESTYRTVILQVIIGLIFIIAGILVAFFFAGSITKPLLAVDGSLSSLAEGSFRKINGFKERKDELGTIINNTNNVVDKLASIVGKITNGAKDVDKSSQELANMSGQISGNASSVSDAVQGIAGGASKQAEELQTATISVQKIEEAAGRVQESTQELAGIATRMQEASAVSAKSLEDLRKSSEDMSTAISDISERISATSDSVGNINNMVEAISSIASQTNLLSLNASIEAARAGEAGKGFAVVAEEIGKLALDSNQSAESIRKEMAALLEKSQAAVSMADTVQKNNEKQQEIITSTFDAVNKMIDDITETSSGVEEISRNAEACVSAKDDVVDVINSLSGISEENAASSQETGASMQELTATVETLSQSASSLKDVSSVLLGEMDFFSE
ncbi:MAG: methyl-accepting chemotaxis protein [Lachnospiraceae bacterium]|nr:methyl-accepting chemotaxis protein [Lachnospiraceae bacterium]